MSKVEVNEIRPQCGTTVTLGGAGETVALGACASSTGFGITGITWCTTAKTAAFCAAAGSGYLVNTTSTAFAATLPASPTVGDQISFVDFAGTFDSNALTLGRNGKKIKAECKCGKLSSERGAVTVIYTGTTQGWITTSQANAETIALPSFITATGGSPSTGAVSGDYKIHTFTATGPLCVSAVGNPAGSTTIDYLVVAGGGGGGQSEGGGGGGAGGYRESVPSPAAWTGSPIASPGGALTASVSDYTITVGAGGATCTSPQGGTGTTSVFSTITSAGGGGGGGFDIAGATGGSGGGGGGRSNYAGGTGNNPATPIAQGFAGGNSKSPGTNPDLGGGGGGALAAGTQGGTAPNAPGAGPGGGGATTCISASPVAYAGGGGGGKDADSPNGGSAGAGGVGGGGRGSSTDPASPWAPSTAAGVNSGGGGGGKGGGAYVGSAGGSGVVIVRYKFQ